MVFRKNTHLCFLLYIPKLCVD